MYSIGDIMGQKIGEIQGRLPYGVTIGSLSAMKNNKPAKTVSTYGNRLNGSYNTYTDNDMSFDDILKEVLTTHRVNPSTYVPGSFSSIFPRYGSYSRENIDPYNEILSYINRSNTAAPSSNYDSIIDNKSTQYGVPADLIRAIIKAESNFNTNLVSNAGAMGLMQLMPATAKGLGVTDAFDPEQNIDGGVRYIKYQLDRFKGNLDLALAAYNWGPNNVIKNNLTDLTDPAQFAKLPRETQNYIRKIHSYMGI